jgi:hypothetical protein
VAGSPNANFLKFRSVQTAQDKVIDRWHARPREIDVLSQGPIIKGNRPSQFAFVSASNWIFWRQEMNAKTAILAGLLAGACVLPAAAQTSYFIVQDPHTKHCQIVDKRPTESEIKIVNPDGSVYTTRNDAETGMKTVKVCTED